MIVSLIIRLRKLRESDWFLAMRFYIRNNALFYQKVQFTDQIIFFYLVINEESYNLLVQLTKK